MNSAPLPAASPQTVERQQIPLTLEEQEHFHHATLAILAAGNADSDISGLCQSIQAILGRCTDISGFAVTLHDKNSGSMNTVYDRKQDNASPLPPVSFVTEVMRQKRTLHCPATDPDARSPQPASLTGIPLMLDGEPVGVMVMQHSSQASRLRNEKLLELLVPQVATVILLKVIRDSLRRKEEHFDRLVTSMPSTVFTTSASGTIKFISPALERLIQRETASFRDQPWHRGVDARKHPHLAAWLASADGTEGETLGDLLHPEDRPQVFARLDAALAESGTYSVEYRILLPGGRSHFVQETGRVKESSHGRCIEGLIHDTHAQRSAQEINQVLFEISNAVNTTPGLDKLYESIHKSLHRVVDATNFYIALYDRQRDVIEFPYQCDLDEHIKCIPQASTSKGYTAQIIFSGKPMLVGREQIAALHRCFDMDERLGTPSQAWIGVPLKINNQVIGAMACQSYTDPHLYTLQDILVLTSISDQVAIAIERGRFYDALRKSEEQVRALSLQTQQFSLAAAALLEKNNLQDILHSFCTAIVEHSGYTRSNITLLKKEPPYYESVDVGGLNPAAWLDMTTPEASISGFLKLFASGSRLGRSSYYVSRTRNSRTADIHGELTWNPGDYAYVRMNDSSGNLLGVICVESSKSGLRPSPETIRPLEIFSALISQIIIHKRVLDDLETARAEAEKATRMKSQFLANMSHEIRTPLNAILGLTDLVLDSDLSHTQAASLLKIQSAGKSLLGILNNVLDFSKIEAGMLHLERSTFSLRDVMREIFELLAPQAAAKQIELILHPDPSIPDTLHADPLRLRQILLNLLDNAIKFTEKGHVVVFLDTREEKDGTVSVHFQIEDTGVGVPEAAMTDLFESFAQADGSTTRRYGGTGLGLAISKQLVQLMGGSIWARSKPGQGSTFGFSIPGQSRGTAKIPRKTWQILVVDNNTAVLRAIQAMLTAHEADAAGSEDAALRLIRERSYDFLLIKDSIYDSCGQQLLDAHTVRHATHPQIVMLCAQDSGQEVNGPSPKRLGKPVCSGRLHALLARMSGLKSSTPPHHPVRQAVSLAGKSLLVVEDNVVNQEVARRILIKAGADVAVATDGIEALEVMQGNHFDLVLMDIQMPRMDGYTATRKIREHFGPDIPVMAMTAHAMENNHEESLACGMNDFIAKPVDSSMLLKKIKKLLNASTEETHPEPVSSASPEEVLNRDEALERLNNDQQLHASLLRLFVQRHADIREVSQAILAGDFDTAGQTLHTMRGAAATIGGGRLVEAIADLEQALAKNSTPAIDACLSEFLRSHAALLAAIAEPVSHVPLPDSATPDMVHLRPVLEELLGLLRRNNLKADAAVLNLGRLLRGTRLQEWMNSLKEQVNNLDYRAAADMTQTLLDSISSSGSDHFALSRHETDRTHR